MVDFVTNSDHQSVPVPGQQIVLLAAYSGTAATTGTASARVRSATKTVNILLSNVTSVGAAAVTLQGSQDGTTWTTLTTVASTVTTQTSYSTNYTDTTTWVYYRVNTAANASTNTMQVVLSF
jgi:hypothetical protein